MPFLPQSYRTHRRRCLAGGSLIAIIGACHAAYADESTTAATPDELVITGQLYATSKTLEEQKKSDTVSSVISADDMGRIPDATVAEAITRVPGVNIINDQETGEGQYVTVRSLASTYNAFSINGIRVAQTDPGSRQVSLDVLPPNGLSGVKVYKTLTPDMDGDAIGGTVDVRTPTAFDFDKPLARLFYNYGINDRANKDHDPDSANSGQIDFAWRFGPGERFGVYLTGYYTDTNMASEETENDGEWTPYLYPANSQVPIDQRTLNLPGVDLDYRVVRQQRGGGNVSLDYHGDDTTLYLRSQYADYTRTETHNQLTVKSRPTTRTNPDGSTCSSFYSSCSPSGTYDPQAFFAERSLYTQDQHETLGTLDLGGESRIDRLTIDYETAYSWGELAHPRNYSASFTSASGVYPFNSTGLHFTSADPRFPVWQLPAYAQGAVYDNSLLLPDGASLNRDKSTDSRVSAKLDVRYDLPAPSWAEAMVAKAGVKYQQSDRKHDYQDITEDNFNTANLATSGLIGGYQGCILRCVYTYGSILSRSAVIAAIDKLGPTAGLGIDDQNGNDTKNRETIYAGYAMGNIKIGDVEMIAGLRAERTDVNNTFWVQDTVSHWGTNSKSYTEILPSLNVNWRPTPDEVYRAAIWTSFARPEYSYISGGSSVTRDAAGNISAISQGNPDLKPATALNFDLSAEWYLNKTSMVSVAPYYKRIQNFIFTNGNDVSANNTKGVIEITQPQNGQEAKVYGIEFGLTKDLKELAPPFDGFSLFGNLTRQNSAADTGIPYRRGQLISLIYASKLAYNGGVSFQKWGLESQLSYHWQSPYIEDLRSNGIDKWVQPLSSLNFSSRYTFTNGFTIGVDATNLTDNYTYYTSKGNNPAYQKDYIEPGRTIMLKASFTL